MSLGNIVDQLHNQDCFADTSTAEQTNLSSLGVGGEEVDNLDASDQDLLLHTHVLEVGSLGVDGLSQVSGDGSPLVNWVTNDIDDPAKSLGTDRDHDGVASVIDHLAPDESLGTVHGNGPDSVLSQVLGNLEDELGLPVLHDESIEDL